MATGFATADFDLPKKKKIATSFSNKWSCDITTSESILAQRHFIEHFFIATQQRGISYLLTSYAIHHFSIHNSYFTRQPLMLSWSIWSYQGPRREGCYGWAIPRSNNRCFMESTIMVLLTLCPHHYNKHKTTTCGPILCLHLSQEHDTGGCQPM